MANTINIMLKRFSVLFLALILGFSSSFATGPDDKAARILEESKKAFESLNDFATNFTYVIQNKRMNNAPAPRQGQLKYSKGMYAILLSDQEIYCNLDNVWLYIKDEDAPEVSIMDYDKSESFNIEGIFDLYKHGSKAKYIGQESVDGSSCHKIYVAVNDPKLGYNQATVWINARTNLPVKVMLKDRNQTETIYQFSNFEKNRGFTHKDFEFNVSNFNGDVYDETE